MISAIVLATEPPQPACESKLFAPLQEKPVLQWVLESVLAANVAEVVCVVSSLVGVPGRISLSDERLHWLVDNSAVNGGDSPLIAGLWAVAPESDGALVVAGDEPLFGSELFDALIRRFDHVSALMVAPSCSGRVQAPVLFRREFFPEALRLSWRQGDQPMLDKHRDLLEVVAWENDALLTGAKPNRLAKVSV